MLRQLTIENYALIRKLNISFEQGFSVITGETGAGKSIILGALGLILGERADSGVLLDKNIKCIVEGVFDLKAQSGNYSYLLVRTIPTPWPRILTRENPRPMPRNT